MHPFATDPLLRCDNCWCAQCEVPASQCDAWPDHCRLTRAQCRASPPPRAPAPSGIDALALLRDLEAPRSSAEISTHAVEAYLPTAVALYDHQIRAAAFFANNVVERRERSGILASHMGQGKTWSIALLARVLSGLRAADAYPDAATLRELASGAPPSRVHDLPRTTLWMVPNSQVRQLASAILECYPKDVVRFYYGTEKTCAFDDLAGVRHVVTTPFMRLPFLSTPVAGVRWGMLVVDESHLAERSGAAGYLVLTKAAFKLLVTGSLFGRADNATTSGIAKQLAIVGKADAVRPALSQAEVARALRRFTFRSNEVIPMPTLAVRTERIVPAEDERRFLKLVGCMAPKKQDEKTLGLPFLPSSGHVSLSPYLAAALDMAEWDVFTEPAAKHLLAPVVVTSEYLHLPALGAANRAVYERFTQTPALRVFGRLRELIAQSSGERFVVFVGTRECFAHIKRALQDLPVRLFNGTSLSPGSRQLKLEQFEGAYDGGSVYVTTYLNAATGLNMTGRASPCGVGRVVLMSAPNSVRELEQAICRVYRQGNPAPRVVATLLYFAETRLAWQYASWRDACVLPALRDALRAVPGDDAAATHGAQHAVRRVTSVVWHRLLVHQDDAFKPAHLERVNAALPVDWTTAARMVGMSLRCCMCDNCGAYFRASKPSRFSLGCEAPHDDSVAKRAFACLCSREGLDDPGMSLKVPELTTSALQAYLHNSRFAYRRAVRIVQSSSPPPPAAPLPSPCESTEVWSRHLQEVVLPDARRRVRHDPAFRKRLEDLCAATRDVPLRTRVARLHELVSSR